MAADQRQLPSAFLVATSFFVFAFFSLRPGAVEGVVVVVGPGNSISSALAGASAGDEIQVAAGNYSEPPVVVTSPDLTLRFLGEVVVAVTDGETEWLTIKGASFSMLQSRLNLTGGIGLDGGGVILQDNDVVMTLADVNNAVGVDIRNGTWFQSGRLDVGVFPTNFDFSMTGVRVGAAAQWKQADSFVEAHTGPFVTAVLLDGVWEQNGPVSISADQGRAVRMNSNAQWIGTASVDLTHSGYLASGVYIAETAVWTQSGGTFTANGTNTNSCDPACYVVGCWGEWIQGGNAVIDISEGPRGVYLGPVGKWTQNGNIALTVASTSATTIGVDGQSESSPSPAKVWNQKGPVSFNVTGNLAAGLICGSGFSWFSSFAPVLNIAPNATGIGPNCAPLPFPSSTPAFIISNSTNLQNAPTLLINLTTAAVTLLPQDASGQQQSSAAVSLSLGTISSRNTNSTRTAAVLNGKWATVENNTLGADQSFNYSCELQFDSAKREAGGTMLGLQFYLFSNTTEVNLGGDTPVKFNVSPAFAKFTVRLTDWVWQSADDPDERAEVRVAITPAFTGFFEVAGDEADFVREFALTGQQTAYSGRASTRIRLVEAVELDGKLVTAKEAGSNGRKAVEFTLDANSSSLVVSFARFNTSAVFDPDLGVLLTGRSSDGGGGSDNTGLIIGVAVAVPLAVLLVLVVIVSAVVITYWRKKKQVNIAAEAAINFNPDDGL